MMIRPYDYNTFTTQKHLIEYLEYLKGYLSNINLNVVSKKFYLDKKLHIEINIFDQEESLFNEVVKISDPDNYKQFDKNLFMDMDYYIISKELTLESMRNDKNYLLKFSGHTFDLSKGLIKSREKLFQHDY